MRVMVIVKPARFRGRRPAQPETPCRNGEVQRRAGEGRHHARGEGLQASSKGVRVRFSGAKRTVIDGPFTETKELNRRLLVVAGEVDGRGH